MSLSDKAYDDKLPTDCEDGYVHGYIEKDNEAFFLQSQLFVDIYTRTSLPCNTYIYICPSVRGLGCVYLRNNITLQNIIAALIAGKKLLDCKKERKKESNRRISTVGKTEPSTQAISPI